MYTTETILEKLLKDLLYPYITGFTGFEESLEKVCANFVYIHDINSTKILEDLSDDFETSGEVEYKVYLNKDEFFNIVFYYCDGDLDDIDYSIENKQIFKQLIKYATRCLYNVIEDSIIDNNEL